MPWYLFQYNPVIVESNFIAQHLPSLSMGYCKCKNMNALRSFFFTSQWSSYWFEFLNIYSSTFQATKRVYYDEEVFKKASTDFLQCVFPEAWYTENANI